MKITLLLVCFVASFLVASAQQPKMICKLNNGTEKQYNIADIENLSFMKSSDPLYLTVFYNATSRKFTTTQIDSITLHNSILTIFSKPTGFMCTLAEVDSVVTQKIIQSQEPSIEWQKCYGGTDNDYATSIQQTSDGGYIVAGQSNSKDGDVTVNHVGGSYWIVKLTSVGTIEWQKSLGGSHGDAATSIQQTNDGGYIVAGYSHSNDGDVTGNHGGSDYWIVKLTSVGTIEWQKSLGGTGTDRATSIQQTSDGGYIVAGDSDSNNGDITGNHGYTDYWIVKLTSDGFVQWQKSFGGSSYDKATSIQQTSEGGYIVAGWSNSNDGDLTGNHSYSPVPDYWIIKFTSGGTIEWQKSLGGGSEDRATSIQQTNDGGYIVAGWSISNTGDVIGNHGDQDFLIVKLNSNGAIQLQQRFGGIGDDSPSSIQQTSDGGYIISGGAISNNHTVTGNSVNYWIVKLTNGSILWQETLGGSGADFAASIQQTSDNSYIIAGSSSSKDGDVTGNHGGYDYWIVKLKAP